MLLKGQFCFVEIVKISWKLASKRTIAKEILKMKHPMSDLWNFLIRKMVTKIFGEGQKYTISRSSFAAPFFRQDLFFDKRFR